GAFGVSVVSAVLPTSSYADLASSIFRRTLAGSSDSAKVVKMALLATSCFFASAAIAATASAICDFSSAFSFLISATSALVNVDFSTVWRTALYISLASTPITPTTDTPAAASNSVKYCFPSKMTFCATVGVSPSSTTGASTKYSTAAATSTSTAATIKIVLKVFKTVVFIYCSPFS